MTHFAYKVVTDRYLSPAADDHPHIHYRLGPVRQIGPTGVYAYTDLGSAMARANWARKSAALMSSDAGKRGAG